VYQRDSLFDVSRVDAIGRTNLQRMQRGLAPLDRDGMPINLHHLLQTMDGPIAELTAQFHSQYGPILNINPNTIGSGINRTAFAQWRSQYWAWRAQGFNP
jgi:filamentous hemagglutinin